MSTVFKFTFLQQIKSKSYIIATFVIALLLLLLSAGTLIVVQAFTKDEVKSDIDYVFVSDSSILSGLDYNLMHNSGKELYRDIVFINASGDIEAAAKEAAEKSDHAAAIEVKNNENGGFEIRVVKPEGFIADKKSAKNLAGFIEDSLKYVIYEKSSLTEQQMDELLVKTKVSMMKAGGESSSEDEEMIKSVIPAGFGLLLYMMLCIYGQGIARSVVLEKDSKMMETLLVIVRPYTVIFGKLFGICLAAIMQLVIWMISLIIGFCVGIGMTGSVGSKVSEFIGKLAEKGGFSPAAIIFAVLSLLIGFVLYASLSAFVGSFAPKTEEVNSYYGIYTMIVVVCWMIPYISSINGNDHLAGILRYIPFTAPFILPADVLIGNANIMTGIISTVMMLAATALIVFLAAKVYKAFVLYRGNPPKIKDIINMVKSNN